MYQSIESVISNLTAVNKSCRELGDSVVENPFMLFLGRGCLVA